MSDQVGMENHGVSEIYVGMPDDVDNRDNGKVIFDPTVKNLDWFKLYTYL